MAYITTARTSKQLYLAQGSTATRAHHPIKHGCYDKFCDVWETVNTVGSFHLGRSATKTIIPSTDSGDQIGNLKHYWQRRYTSHELHGDYDYAVNTGPNDDTVAFNDSNISNKKRRSSKMFAWKEYFRGINTATLPTYSMDTRIGRNESIDLEIDRDNNKFEDVWFITKCKYAAGIPTDRGLEISMNYPEASGGGPTIWDPRREGWKQWGGSSALDVIFGGVDHNA